MHDTALEIGGLFLRSYARLDDADVLEIGAYNVNGSLRDYAQDGTRWTGVDLEEGPGVDVVTQPGAPLPVLDDGFDVVLASSVFEHDPAFWVTFLDMCRKVRVGGYIYINVPSNGSVHRYPRDNWRFYPDSGKALADWATSQGQDVVLVESFIASRQRDQWNDFVAIFRKGQPDETDEQRLIHPAISCANVFVWNRPGILHDQSMPEDMTLLSEAQARTRTVQQRIAEAVGAHQVVARQLSEAMAELDAAKCSVLEAQARAGDLETQLAANVEILAAERNRAENLGRQLAQSAHSYQAEIAARGDALAARQAEVAHLQSRLAQREEELAQLWRERDDLAAQCDLLNQRAERAEARLAESDAWVFQLAGERRSAEQGRVRLQTALGTEQRLRERAEGKAIDWQARAERHADALGKVSRALSQAEHDRDLAQTRLATSHDLLRDTDQKLHLARCELHHRFRELADLTRLLDERYVLEAQLRHQVEHATSRLAETENLRNADFAMFNRQLQDHQGREVELRQQVEEAESRLAEAESLRNADTALLNRQLEEAEEKASLLAESAYDRSREIASLSSMLHQTEQALGAQEKRRHQIAEIAATLVRGLGSGRSLWTRWLPVAGKADRLAKSLKEKGVFDPDAYLEAYPDVAAAGEHPLRHYLIHGVREGRSAHSVRNDNAGADGRA